MSIFFNPFRIPARAGNEWFSVGLASSFPDVGLSIDGKENVSENEVRLCGGHGPNATPGCKVFQVPKDDPSQRTEVILPVDEGAQDLTDQVLVFQYRGKFHAIDHVRCDLKND